MLVDSGSSKHFVDLKLIRRIESRVQDYTEINLPMEIKASGHNTLTGTAQGILLVVDVRLYGTSLALGLSSDYLYFI